jgi:uncharacterized membrane protein (UPF0127 family)
LPKSALIVISRFIHLLGMCSFLGIVSCAQQKDNLNIDEIKIKQACEIDAECVGDWWVGSTSCGNIERCIDRQCQLPLAMSGEISDLKQEGLYTTLSCTYISDQSEKIILERKIEWARGEFALTRGLMCRESMLDDWAMGLVFTSAGSYEITMHLMQFPIVLIALAENGEVLDVVRLGLDMEREKNLYVTPEGTQIVIEMKDHNDLALIYLSACM